MKKTFLIDLEWSIVAKGKVAISKTVPTAASRYKHNIYQPTIGITKSIERMMKILYLTEPSF